MTTKDRPQAGGSHREEVNGLTRPMSNAVEKAREFIECQKAFRLGELLTESFHPKTCNLSQVIQADVEAGVRLLQSVDEDIPAALDRIFAQESVGTLTQAFCDAMSRGRRIFFTGCGSTGRLSILLEAAWREFWRRAEPANSRMADLCVSIMAGGDFALIKAVEGFEDFPDFGRRQIREAGLQRDDVVVAITEGGETPFVIGTAWQGLDAGAHVFFVYNNPTDLLRRHVQRSREVIEESRIHKLDLATGPMAITGSTRMQATTAELLVVGAALEMALVRFLRKASNGRHIHSSLGTSECKKEHADASVGMAPGSSQEYQRQFENLLRQLCEPQAVTAIAHMAELEERVYRRHGLVTYLADSLMLDVLTDTTERSPTFMIPPFRGEGDASSPASWAFVKNPHCPTERAWREMLQREPRGLTWGPEVFKELHAPPALQTAPPKLDNSEIHRFRIGNEPDPSRTDAADSMLVRLGELPDPPSSITLDQYSRTMAITFGPSVGQAAVDDHIHILCDVPKSPLRLWEHLAAKLILNTISTATMARMGRVIGNAMIWLSPSNKKLIDRGTRLVCQVTGSDYDRACEVLHQAMEDVAERAKRGEEVPSPVALAIERIEAEVRGDTA